MPLRGRVLPAPPRRRRPVPAASRRPRGILRRYAAVPIAEVDHSAAQRPPTRACAGAWTENSRMSRPAPSAGVALVRPRASGGLQDTYPPRYLARTRAGYQHRSQISRLGARVPRRVNHKRTTDRRMPRGDHGQDSRRPTCCDGCAGEARPWSRTGSKRPRGQTRLRGLNPSGKELRYEERTSHRHRSDEAYRRPRAIQNIAVSAQPPSSPPPLPCPPRRTSSRRSPSPRQTLYES